MVARSQASETLIEAGDVALPALLRLPADARALVIFVHGSGSSRHSSRNQFVAESWNAAISQRCCSTFLARAKT